MPEYTQYLKHFMHHCEAYCLQNILIIRSEVFILEEDFNLQSCCRYGC